MQNVVSNFCALLYILTISPLLHKGMYHLHTQ